MINISKRNRDKNIDFEGLISEEVGQTKIGSNIPSGFVTMAKVGNQNLETKFPSSFTLTNNTHTNENKISCVKDIVSVVKTPSLTASATRNGLISSPNVSLPSQTIIMHKDTPRSSTEISPLSIPGRCELSVTPLIKVSNTKISFF